jgi:hypothetical protein
MAIYASCIPSAIILSSSTGCAATPAKSNDSSMKPTRLTWILSSEDFARIQSADPQLTEKMTKQATVYVLRSPGSASHARNTTPTALFTSYSAFASDVANNAIVPGTQAVAYDPEYWAATPVIEQQNPVHYMRLFAQEAQEKGYRAILMPGRDLTLAPNGVCSKRSGETLNDAYLRCNIAQAASYSNIFEIQCAPIELNISELQKFVQESAKQARAANKSALLTATLSTAPGGVSASLIQITRSFETIRPYVDGYQFNSADNTRSIQIRFLQTQFP